MNNLYLCTRICLPMAALCVEMPAGRSTTYNGNTKIYMQTDSNSMMQMQGNEIVLYQPNDAIHLEVRLAEESVWLTLPQIALLFGVQRPAITKHLRNIFNSGELEEKSVSSILEHTAGDGKTYRTQFYNLDAILSVGYRVNSINATMFHQWDNSYGSTSSGTTASTPPSRCMYSLVPTTASC